MGEDGDLMPYMPGEGTTGCDGTFRSPTPALSVIIACYNAEGTLTVQLDALCRQVDPVPFEVIVSDNGSTDRSRSIAQSYAGRLALRVIDSSGVQGPAHARNVGVANARAQWIGFCDADDEVADDWIRELARSLDEHVFIAGRVSVAKLNRASVSRSRTMEQQDSLQPSSVALDYLHAGAGNMGLHREAFMRVGGFDESLMACEDTDFCIKMQLTGYRLHYEPRVLIETRLRSHTRHIVRQGYQYGLGQARLEQRYGDRSSGGGQSGSTMAPEAGRLERVRTQLRTVWRLPMSGKAWQLGWSVGHRVGRRRYASRTGEPVVPPVGRPRATVLLDWPEPGSATAPRAADAGNTSAP